MEMTLDEWLQSMQPSIAGWTSQLPTGFRDDYTRASLVTVERVLLKRYPNPTADLTGPGSLFLESTARYIGEALLRVSGGHWERSDRRGLWPDQPVIVPGTPDQLPIAPFAVVTDIVRGRAGNELTSLWDRLDEQRQHRQAAEPGWTPVKTPTPGLDRVPVPPAEGLDAFLATRDHDLAQWTRVSERPADTWDLTLQSLDALGRTVLDAGFTREQVTRPEPDSFGWCAMRYLAETLIALYGGTWEWRADTTGKPISPLGSSSMYLERWMVRRDDPADTTYAFPDLHVGRVIRRSDPSEVRAAADRYAEIDV